MEYFISKEFTELLYLLEMEDFDFTMNYETPQATIFISLEDGSKSVLTIKNTHPNDDGVMPLELMKDDVPLHFGIDVELIFNKIHFERTNLKKQ